MAKEDEDEKTKEEVEAATEEAPAEEGMDEPNEEESPTARANREAYEADKEKLKEQLAEELLAATSGDGGTRDAGGVQALVNSLAEQIRQERAGAAELAKQKPGAPDLADLIVSLLPAAIGAAVGDSRTALAGAVGGMTGLSERRAKQSEAISEEIKAREKYAQTLEGRMINLQGKVAAALAGKENYVPPQILEQATGYMSSAINAQRTLDFLNKFFPKNATKETYAQWATRKLKVEFSPELSNEAIFANLMTRLKLDLQAGIKGVPSNADQVLINKFLTGAGNIDSLPKVRAALEDSVKTLTNNANLVTDNFRKFSQGKAFTVADVQSYAEQAKVLTAEERKKAAAGEQEKKVGSIRQVDDNDKLITIRTPQGQLAEVSVLQPWMRSFLLAPGEGRMETLRKLNAGKLSQREKEDFLKQLQQVVNAALSSVGSQQGMSTQ